MSLLTHLHPAIVHFPIALLLLGSAIALVYLYRLGGQDSPINLRQTAWLLIGLGWLATIPAILSGLLAQASLPPDAPYRNILNWHTATGIAVLIFYGLLLYKAWIFQGAKARKARAARQRGAGQRDAGQEKEVADLLDNPSSRLWLTVALFGGIALIVATGWNGGILVYEWGVNVLG